MRRPTVLLAVALAAAAAADMAAAQVKMSECPENRYEQSFDALPTEGGEGVKLAWADNLTIPGWYAAFATQAWYSSGDGTGKRGGLWNLGKENDADRALGAAASGTTGDLVFGVRLKNDTGKTVKKVAVAYTGELWRRGGTRQDTEGLRFSYQAGKGPLENLEAAVPGDQGLWVAVQDLDFTGSRQGDVDAARDGNAAENRREIGPAELPDVQLQPGDELLLRWRDIDNIATDDFHAVDDLRITWETE